MSGRRSHTITRRALRTRRAHAHGSPTQARVPTPPSHRTSPTRSTPVERRRYSAPTSFHSRPKAPRRKTSSVRSAQIRDSSTNIHFRWVFWGRERPQKKTTITKSVLTPPNDAHILAANPPVAVASGSFGKSRIRLPTPPVLSEELGATMSICFDHRV